MTAKTTAMKTVHGDGYDRADYGYDDRYRDEIPRPLLTIGPT